MEHPTVADALTRPASGSDRLGAWDDYPVHQSAGLLSSVSPAQPGWSERFYFNILRPTGEIAAIMGAGVYPLRGVSEAYFCRMDGDRQVNLRAFNELPAPGADLGGGPFSLRCETPLHDWSVGVDLGDESMSGRFCGLAEPYLYDPVDVPASEPGGEFDLFRHFIAVGRWELMQAGPLGDATDLIGVRDRTWGVRTRRIRWHNWCVFWLGDTVLTLIHQELADGTVMHSEAGFVRANGETGRLRITGHDVTYDPHDRQVTRARWEFDGEEGPLLLEYERVGLAMRLAGAGYDDTQGARGTGDAQRDSYDLADPDVARRTGRGTMDQGARGQVSGAWAAEGIGVVESAIARNHVGYGSQLA
jgi:hypothetical protein